MGDWIAAVFGLVGAVVGASAAIWGANRAAQMSANLLVVQLRAEDQRWQRDQRQAAYQAMLNADRRLTDACAVAVRNRGDEPPGIFDQIAAASEEAREAARLLEIPGPQSVVDAATQLLVAENVLLAIQPIRTQDLRRWREALQQHQVVAAAFRRAARSALGYVDLEVPALPPTDGAI
ncbi:hypothetical protein [Streptomyces sp. NPDC058252]|uniref:hypothetical protein n=1 Tax=unclassified Streptomyces TaxID=2593676 RepID=UPI0036E3AF00